MATQAGYRTLSAVIYYVLFFALLFPIALATIFAGSVFSGGWGIAASILAFLVTAGLAIEVFRKVRRWRANGFYRLTFPGYSGQRYPAFHLVHTEIDGLVRQSRPPLGSASIAEAGDQIFMLQAARSERPEQILGGTILTRPPTGEAWSIRREDVIAIDVFELSDTAVAAAAVDKASYSERLVEEGVNRVLGVKTKRKIVPFAAFVSLTARSPGGDDAPHERWTFAVPTEISDDTMHFMGLGPRADSNEIVDAAIGHAVSNLKAEVRREARERIEDVVGEAPIELAEDMTDLKEDIDYWVNVGAAKIATTNGARGRAMARIIAERLRNWAGLDLVFVTTLKG